MGGAGENGQVGAGKKRRGWPLGYRFGVLQTSERVGRRHLNGTGFISDAADAYATGTIFPTLQNPLTSRFCCSIKGRGGREKKGGLTSQKISFSIGRLKQPTAKGPTLLPKVAARRVAQ